ncbi:MAG: pyrroline-5-carboxylate reductase [Firmicutes bacterium HGW-Firmicutes-14]|nr:MAG: pyrroline-5-carboxylate reductase [Firmicutes bacterium HGW-Firmicutes-14]
MPFINKKIGFIGAGAMAEALIRSMLQGGLITPPSGVWASDIDVDRGRYLSDKYGIIFVENNKDLIEIVDAVIYAVKPFMMEQVVSEVSPHVREGQLHISIAAGIPLRTLEQNLPSGTPVIRVMPNTPCLIGEGASAYALGAAAGEEDEELVKEILKCAGTAVKVAENLMNAVTGLSGSGPAYVFLILEALIDGAVKAGLPRDVASVLASQTLAGSARLVQESGEHPARLKDMVTTPGGTTIAGLHVLEQGKLRAVLIDAVMAAARRAEELGSGKK